MDESALVRLIGFPACLLHGDTLVLDRWLWLRPRLPRTGARERLLDIGCGSGAFSIGAALRGYESLGLSWDARNQHVARERARLCRATMATFEVMDVRTLGRHAGLQGRFDVALCLENIEHVIDDDKLLRDAAACLKPGGRLLLTTPNLHYRAITPDDDGPFAGIEDGGHVRRGYSEERLRQLCRASGLEVDRITFCSGLLSQKVTWLFRRLCRVHRMLGWIAILPLRPLPPILDPLLAKATRWPAFSICLEARKAPAEQASPDSGHA